MKIMLNFLLFQIFFILQLGTELEWKVVQSNMEAAASELLSATNELSIASRKADSVSGAI